MDAFTSFFDSQSSSLNRWTYESLKNFRQISPVVQNHLKLRIFSEYKQPFSLTYLGVSLMVVYLPVAAFKDWVCSFLSLSVPLPTNEYHHSPETDITSSLITDKDISDREEGFAEKDKNQVDEPFVLAKRNQLGPLEIVKCGLILTPVWFITEYLSNSALATTSVASTTVLTSTSGLFTLLFGALLRQDSLNIPKMVAVFISMAGVAMTSAGKTWAPDESTLHYAVLLLMRLLELTCILFGTLNSISSANNYLNNGGMWSMLGMDEQGPAKNSMSEQETEM